MVESYINKNMISAPELAEKFNINKRALMPSLHRLTQAGYLRSQIGGSNPGFIFTRDPRQISVTEIIRALEGELRMEPCRELLPDVNCACVDCESCMFHNSINKLIADSKAILSKTTLYDLYESTLDGKSTGIDFNALRA